MKKKLKNYETRTWMVPLPNLMRLPAVPFFFFPPAAREVAISTA
jgi:hypothetical protein